MNPELLYTKDEIFQLINGGENSSVEFKSDEVKADSLAKEVVAFSTGLEFTFDFQIAQKNQEIVLKSFNSLNKLNFTGFLFAWEDIKPLRERITKKEVKAIAILNDVDKEIREEYLEALALKNADYIEWSKRYNPIN